MGKLIVFEGLDGSGKRTHSRIVTEKLNNMGKPSKNITFPNYDEPSSSLVKMYLSGEFGNEPDSVPAYAASAFYAVDRFASFKKFWENDYNNGKIIIADRYVTSNIIHQMVKLNENEWDGYIDWLEDFEYNKMKLPRPDKVFYLDMPPEVSQSLILKRYRNDESKKDIHEKDFEYLLKCKKTAEYAAKKLGWQTIALCRNKAELASKEENNGMIFNELLKELF